VTWPTGPEDLLLATVALSLPSQPTLSRRLRTVGVLQLIEQVQCRLAEALGDSRLKVIDSKPLCTGSYSKDKDARPGRAAGRMAKGYKLHAITAACSFVHWTLLPMNEHDQIGAAMLLPRLKDYGYLSGDNAYDANTLYQQAAAMNHQLIAPPQKARAHVRDLRRNRPERIRSLDLCADPLQHCGRPDDFARAIRSGRVQIERNFGNAAMSGLWGLPPWVRTPHRVAVWVAAKLILRMLRQLEIAGVRT